jgi:hypothetical protein
MGFDAIEWWALLFKFPFLEGKYLFTNRRLPIVILCPIDITVWKGALVFFERLVSIDQ